MGYEDLVAVVDAVATEAQRDAAVVVADRVVASTEDPERLARMAIADLREATEELRRDVFRYVLWRLVESPAVQRVIAPELLELDLRTRERLVERTPANVNPAFLGAALTLWDAAPPETKRNLIRLCLVALEKDRQFDTWLTGFAIDALESNHADLVDAGLWLVIEIEKGSGVALDQDMLARVRSVAERAPALNALRAQTRAFEVLARYGLDLAGQMSAPDPQTRLAAAWAMRNDKNQGERVSRTLIVLVEDRTVDPELRYLAAAWIRHPPARLAAYCVLANAGNTHAPLAIARIGGAEGVAALERLRVEAPSARVRAEAEKALMLVRTDPPPEPEPEPASDGDTERDTSPAPEREPTG